MVDHTSWTARIAFFVIPVRFFFTTVRNPEQDTIVNTPNPRITELGHLGRGDVSLY